MLHVLIIETYEDAAPGYAIVEHRFRGPTKAAALGIYHAHLKSDRFLAGCARGMFAGRVPCHSVMRWERERVYVMRSR